MVFVRVCKWECTCTCVVPLLIGSVELTMDECVQQQSISGRVEEEGVVLIGMVSCECNMFAGRRRAIGFGDKAKSPRAEDETGIEFGPGGLFLLYCMYAGLSGNANHAQMDAWTIVLWCPWCLLVMRECSDST